MDEVVLYIDKKDCCGCGACMNACPKAAISMQEDEYGFIYPIINQKMCVKCGICKNVCGYQKKPNMEMPRLVYAVASQNDNLLMKSASGGAFAVLAEMVIRNNGVVYGAALLQSDGKLEPRHIRVDSLDELVRLQGSKYVQSDIGDTYLQAKRDLQAEKVVLFSGTPCQIAGLRKYVTREYSNLITVDIICHGVPNKRLFQDFIDYHGKKIGGRITEFYFRDKSKGQGMVSRCVYIDANQKEREKVQVGGCTAYIHFFLKSYTYRHNCYTCPFASKKRVGDITVGDFWGFHEEYPDYDEKRGLSNGKGISCMLINTEKGQNLLEICKSQFILMNSDFEKVAKHNEQLHSPSKYSTKREIVMELYKRKKYEGVDRYFRKYYKKDIANYMISGVLPKGFKRKIKKIIARTK